MSEPTRLYPHNAAQSADAVLEQSLGEFSDVIVIGRNSRGEAELRSSLGLQPPDILWLFGDIEAQLRENGPVFDDG